MSISIPQKVLDSLTRVKMPTNIRLREKDETLSISNLSCPVFKTDALVLGSGAAGLRAAVELKRAEVDVTVCSTGLFSGTSACSGSDKQTLHTAGTSNHGDSFIQLARDLRAGGAMDHDTAYVEAVGSIAAFAGLDYLGLPLPQDRFGAVLRYQTDHDDVGRATSCGPRTSRLMVKVLCEEAIRLEIPFLKGTTGVRLLQRNGRVRGVIAINRNRDDNQYGLLVILCDRLVLATGGPGELYRDSVYPKQCFGSLGMAIDAGIKVSNLTESQFGIGTERTNFPWNLSGTYVQAIPYIHSTDSEGNEYNFLSDYYRTTQELASNIFRKGYQWPFHAGRMTNYQSSLIDLAIHVEHHKGRRVLMDFNRNPEPVPGDLPFNLSRLDRDVREYLENNDALQDAPIDRLRRMNPLAIELYRQYKHDIAASPLPFNVNNQHMNGGIDVDIWGQTSLSGCYGIGEVAGTHGVTRPGGAALNAGQVFGTRCAQHIAANKNSFDSRKTPAPFRQTIADTIDEIRHSIDSRSGLSIEQIKHDIQSRMSDHAGFICHRSGIKPALDLAISLNNKIQEDGICISSQKDIVLYFNWKHMARTSEAVLRALHHYCINGGGSRGARALCSPNGTVTPRARNVNLDKYRFIEERPEDQSRKIVLVFRKGKFEIQEHSLRRIENPDEIVFEKSWGNYLVNNICGED